MKFTAISYNKIKDNDTGKVYDLNETVSLLNSLTENDIYVYELYTFIFSELDIGEIYSNRELTIEELIHIIERSIKCIGTEDADSASRVCKKATELLGCEPASENIRKKETFRYYFANEHNCGGPVFSFRQDKEDEQIYDWLKTIYTDYESKRFFAKSKYYMFKGEDDIILYTPCKFGLSK